MKYKLIHSETKEEHICDKVTIDGFDYYVGKLDIGIKDYFEVNGEILQCLTTQVADDLAVSNDYPKVIATNNPNIDIPKVVDEVEKFENEYFKNTSWGSVNPRDHYEALRAGYIKSQETHPFSEEDVIEFVEWCQSCKWFFNGSTKTWYSELFVAIFPETKELLQLWKEQKVKTLYFQ